MDRLADTQRELIEAAERRGYDRGRADAEAELAALRAGIVGLATKCANAVDTNFEYMADVLDDVSVSLLRLLPAEGDEGGVR